MPAKCTGFLIGLAGCVFMLGISFVGVLSAYLLDQFGWKIVIMIGGVIPLIVAVILLLKLPESVQYLVKTQQYDQARIILSQIQGSSISPNITLSLDEARTASTDRSEEHTS